MPDAFAISELPHDALDEATAFLQSRGERAGSEKIVRHLSLSARTIDPDQLVGVALCIEAPGHTAEVLLALAEDAPDAETLATQLVNKAMTKLTSVGLRRCRLNPLDQHPAWKTLKKFTPQAA